MSHVLNGIRVCKPKGICIGGGRILRGGDNTIRFTGDRTKFDATDQHMRMIIFALKWVLVLMTLRKTRSVLVFWRINGWRTVSALQGLGCLIWQKIDKPLSTVLSIRRPWFGHLVDNFLSYLLSYRTKIHVGYIVTIPWCHVGSTQPCQHFHLCVNFFFLITCPPSYTSKKTQTSEFALAFRSTYY
jgi:hypothetical protein